MTHTDKIMVRHKIRELLETLSAESRQEQAHQIFASMQRLESFAKARTVALFWSLPDELPSHEFVRQIATCKRVVLPVVVGQCMEFREFHASDSLHKGAYGIMEPRLGAIVMPTQIDLMVVPGVGFTIDGVRLGRGKGFYDRYLAAAHRAKANIYTVGVCLSCQICEQLPHQEHDIPVDCVISYDVKTEF